MSEENQTVIEEVVTRKPVKKPYFAVWSPLVDKQIVIQQKGGIIITGKFIGQRDGFFVLANAIVKGRSLKASPERILVERVSVAHMHEECPMERVGE
jgi:hypothetical protein